MLRVRHVSRVVVLDAEGSVLLVRHQDADTAESHWVPPGGALEPGEDHRAAAVRELAEETGLRLDVTDARWTRRFELVMWTETVDQIEHFFVARADSVAPRAHNSSPEDIVEHRWWSLEELQATDETIYPEDFLERVRGLLGDEADG